MRRVFRIRKSRTGEFGGDSETLGNLPPLQARFQERTAMQSGAKAATRSLAERPSGRVISPRGAQRIDSQQTLHLLSHGTCR